MKYAGFFVISVFPFFGLWSTPRHTGYKSAPRPPPSVPLKTVVEGR